MRRTAEARQRLRDEAMEERKQTAKHLRNRGFEREARNMEMGLSPFTGTLEGGEELAAMKEDLVNMARGRIITHG
jgi:hypothetical protein